MLRARPHFLLFLSLSLTGEQGVPLTNSSVRERERKRGREKKREGEREREKER
jgi:hypothetical protein